jgi:hypothetical protein
MKTPKRRAARGGKRKAAATGRKREADRIDAEFGPGPAPEREAASPEGAAAARGAGERGPIPGFACGGESCVYAPATSHAARFAARLGPRHIRSLSHAASSGIELMKALRDFLDEEIAIAERAAGKRGGEKRYEKISVE